MNIIINGVTLQGDFMDADFVGPFEEATRKLQDRTIASRGKQYASVAEGYLEQCKTIDAYFDEIFGEGTAARLFQGAEHNVMNHLKAVEALTDWAHGEKKKLNDFTNKYTQRQNAQRERVQQIKAFKKKGYKH